MADIYTAFYHSEGWRHAHEYRFPCEDVSFGFVFLTGVFTDMRPAEVRQYLGEIVRVLDPGRRFATAPSSSRGVETVDRRGKDQADLPV